MQRNELVGIYPGTFDPVTNGHVDIIQRGLQMCDRLVLAILVNIDKTPLFSPEERLEMLTVATAHLQPRVQSICFSGLLVNAARQYQAKVILRGIRAISDYEYELQMALMNRTLAPEIETLFMVPAGRYSFLSSRLVKEVFSHGGAVKDLVPPVTFEMLQKKYTKS